MAVMIENIKVDLSPVWLQKKLLSVWLRPINNIVDITNYLMMDLGQPMHAFDATKIKNEKAKADLIIRSAKEGEEFTTLDEKTYKIR